MRRWILVIAAIAAAVPLAGCGGSTSAQARPSTAAPTMTAAAAPHTSWDVSALPNPCRTITNTQVAAVVGGTVSAGVALESWPPLCQFVLDEQRRTYLYVSDDAGPTGREDYDRKRATSSATQAVDGIGDQAYWQPDLASLHVLGGATHVFVAFGGTPAPEGAKDKAIALARVILPRTHP
jgi:hypothetical protein